MPVSVTIARPATSRSRAGFVSDAVAGVGHFLGSEAAQVGEAPVLVGRRRQGQLVVPLRGVLAGERRHQVARGVAAVQHDRVPVGVREERHVAHGRVDRVAAEDDALGLELLARLRDVRARGARSTRYAAPVNDDPTFSMFSR